MWLEIIITLLLSGLIYIIVGQLNSKPTKSFKVTNRKRSRTVLLKYTSFESFSEKCRTKFNLGRNEKLLIASGEDEKLEFDEECLADLEDKSLLIVKAETSANNNGDDDDDDDENDSENGDWLGSTILGSDSSTGNTAVEIAAIKKWEDVQTGSDIKKHVNKYGLKNITSVLRENMNAWKSKPLNIAVTGESGKGKSSFINAFRGMSPEQEGAADIDEEECTTDCRPFLHPKFDSFFLWDVPGVGTKRFPKETYLDAIKVDRFDFFMIISSGRFSELDSWLAKEILNRKKKFYFIRTKIDTDMKEKKKRFRKRRQQFRENEEFDKMKSSLSAKLYCDVQRENLQIFMISNHHPNKYDFPLIQDQLLQDVPSEKKDAMLFAFKGMSQNILVEKASALKSRIWKVALISGSGATIPIPFLSAGIDTTLILDEVLFYRDQFGLDDQSLKHLADMAGISLEHLKRSVKFRTPVQLFTSAGMAKYVKKHAVSEIVQTAIKCVKPDLGVPFSFGMSSSATACILLGLIETMKQDALEVLMYVTTGITETEIN